MNSITEHRKNELTKEQIRPCDKKKIAKKTGHTCRREKGAAVEKNRDPHGDQTLERGHAGGNFRPISARGKGAVQAR